MTRKFALELGLAIAFFATCSHSAQAQSPVTSAEILPLCKVPAAALESHTLMPGTLATKPASVPNAKPKTPFAIGVEPSSLPLSVANQPLSDLKYGAAPAVVTLHFHHKETSHED